MMPTAHNGYVLRGSHLDGSLARVRLKLAVAERATDLEFDPFRGVSDLSVSGAIYTEYFRSSDVVDHEIPIGELAETSRYFVAVSLSEVYYQS